MAHPHRHSSQTQVAQLIEPEDYLIECTQSMNWETDTGMMHYQSIINQLNERLISHVGGRLGYKLPTKLPIAINL